VPNLSSSRQDPLLVTLGQTIKRIRLEKEVSQEQLALLAQIDRSHVGRIERGDNNVAILTLARIAKVLGMSLTDLMKEARL
jgi:transcriptional regulator with XRE-family HTH domain